MAAEPANKYRPLKNRSNAHETTPKASPRNTCWLLLDEILAKPQFNIIRNNNRFTRCTELLKENSRAVNS